MTGVTRSYARSSVLRGAVWAVGTYGVTMVFYLLLNAIASRWLGPGSYGFFVVALTASMLLGQLGLLGAHRGGLRDASRLDGRDAEHDDAILSVLHSGVRGTVLLTLPLTALVTGSVAAVFAGGGAERRIALALAFAALVWLSGLQKLWGHYLRGLGHTGLASLLEGRSGGALVGAAQTGLLGLTWWLAPETGLVGALCATAAGFAVPVLLSGRVASRHWSHLRPVRGVLADTVFSARRSWRFSVNQVMAYLTTTMDLWIAAALLSAVATSEFSAAHRLAMLLGIPLVALQPAFAPPAARLFASGDSEALQRVLRSGASYATLVTLLLAVPVLAVPEWIIDTVFGPGFGGAAPALVLLTLGGVGNVLSGFCGTALTMAHRESLAATIQTVSVVIRVVAGCLAAAFGGLIALAAVSSVLTATTFAVTWWAARRTLGIRTEPTIRPRLSSLRGTSG